MRKSGPKIYRTLKFTFVLFLSLLFLTLNPLPNEGMIGTAQGSVYAFDGMQNALAERPKRKKRRKKKKKKRKATRDRWIQHEIAPGEVLGSIARNYDVTVKQLKRWNKITDDNIYAGRKLRIKTGVTRSGKTRVEYVVQRGDSFWKIAKQYGTTVKEVKTRNRQALRKRRGRLYPGMRLIVFATRLEGVGIPKGKPQNGRLENGQKMPKMKGVVIRRPRNSYGTWNTIAHLQKCFAQVQKGDRAFPPIMLGNISREGGGKLRPHKSHQNGLDVDIGYIPRKRSTRNGWFDATRKGTMDAARTWKMLKCFLDTGDVQYMFVDYPVQKQLYNYAKKRLKYSAAQLKRYFQYPRGRGSKSLLQLSKGHDDHVHIRFYDPTKRSKRQARRR